MKKLASASEALAAIKSDHLATVYYRSDCVFVATASGSGVFSTEEWKAAGGYENSQVKPWEKRGFHPLPPKPR